MLGAMTGHGSPDQLPEPRTLVLQVRRIVGRLRPFHRRQPDLVADALEQIMRAAPSYDRRLSAVGTWLFAIVRNSVNASDRAWMRDPAARTDDHVAAGETLESGDPGPESALSARELRCRLGLAAKQLAPRARLCLFGLDLWGLTAADVAARVRCSEHAVRHAAHKARVRLRWLARGIGTAKPTNRSCPLWPASSRCAFDVCTLPPCLLPPSSP